MDRVNIGFAALPMNESLGITPDTFGTIASAFFATYLLFQIPGNIILQRIGARRWIGTIMIAWGIGTTLMFFVRDANEVMVMRLVIGACEAGFFPGMVYYLSTWFPKNERAKVTASFMLAIAVASVVSAPLSGWIIEHVRTPYYEGWRWLFAIEGIPTVILGSLTFYALPGGPFQAKWMNDKQRSWLVSRLRQDHVGHQQQDLRMRDVLLNPTLWKLSLAYLLVQSAAQVANYWLPRQLRSLSPNLTDTEVGLMMALPFACAMAAMPL